MLPPSIAPGTDPTWQHTFTCVARFFWVLKALAQAGQVCPLSLEWTDDRCLCRSVRSLKCFRQYTHCINFFLKWMVFSCRSALDLRVKLAGHCEHRYRAGAGSATAGRYKDWKGKGWFCGCWWGWVGWWCGPWMLGQSRDKAIRDRVWRYSCSLRCSRLRNSRLHREQANPCEGQAPCSGTTLSPNPASSPSPSSPLVPLPTTGTDAGTVKPPAQLASPIWSLSTGDWSPSKAEIVRRMVRVKVREIMRYNKHKLKLSRLLNCDNFYSILHTCVVFFRVFFVFRALL